MRPLGVLLRTGQSRSFQCLKAAVGAPEVSKDDAPDLVKEMLAQIVAGGEQRVVEYTKELDKHEGDILMTQESIQIAIAQVPESVKRDIDFAHAQIKAFAEEQRKSITDFEVDLFPGVKAGQTSIPVDVAGCYVPGGEDTRRTPFFV